jgi:hypothetical protein
MRDSSSSTRGRRLPMLFMLLAMVVATAVVAIGVALGGGGMAGAAPATSGATLVATSFQVGGNQTNEAYAKCPGNKRALSGGVVQSGDPVNLGVRASGPLDETNVTANTQSGDVAKQWYAAEYNGGTQPKDLKVFAICQ